METSKSSEERGENMSDISDNKTSDIEVVDAPGNFSMTTDAEFREKMEKLQKKYTFCGSIKAVILYLMDKDLKEGEE